jgi:hypothetical protein
MRLGLRASLDIAALILLAGTSEPHTGHEFAPVVALCGIFSSQTPLSTKEIVLITVILIGVIRLALACAL